MAETSNIREVVAWLEGFVNSFDFTRPGKDQSLGRDIAMTIIRGPDVGGQGGILGRAAENSGPEGYWIDNADSTKAEKRKHYGWEEVNRRTGQMLSQESLYGHTTIEPRLVTLRYGTGRAPDRSAAPSGYISDADRAVTDVQKAEWAHGGGSSAKGPTRDVRGRFAARVRKATARTARPFYGFTDEDRSNVIGVTQENLDDYIRTA